MHPDQLIKLFFRTFGSKVLAKKEKLIIVKNKKVTVVLLVCILLALLLVLAAVCHQQQAPASEPDEGYLDTETDYSAPENWAYYALGEEKPVDLFLICPTVDM